ncbi:hypothetical protein F4778DRAFT_729738 [Xylariomycetidae sp. FL2044]|nr:hypothetical protein F4778DRAFT_729738 [Xylariomycetidae sp. FL2044]
MMDNPPVDISRAIWGEQIRHLSILQLEPLTPLLRHEMRHVIELHSKAAEDPDIDQNFTDIGVLYSRITSQWTKIYGNPTSRAYVMQDIILFRRFLTSKLLEDYAMEPFTTTTATWLSGQVAFVEKGAKAESGSTDHKLYQLHIVRPLEELMLNRDHVENKLLSTRRSPGSHIEHLISTGDWPALAVSLINDRELVKSLYKEEDRFKMYDDKNADTKILRGIDKVQNKYATELSNSGVSEFTRHGASEAATQASGMTFDIYGSVTSAFRDLGLRARRGF